MSRFPYKHSASTALCCVVAGAAGCGGSSTHTQTISASEQAKLHQIAVSGGPVAHGAATDIEVVKTTYPQFQKVLGGPPKPPGAGDVYLIGMHRSTKLPSGRTFPYLVVVVDATTNRRIVAVPSPTAPQLSRLGPVTKL